jgi:hypothetical protein
MMTKDEVTGLLMAKFAANQAECRRLLEYIAGLEGHEIVENGTDLFKTLSERWKQGAAIREMAQELVPILYQAEAKAPEDTVLQ